MMTPDERAIEALRRLDRPHRPDVGTHERIEARILERFDAAVNVGESVGEVELLERHRAPQSPTRTWVRGLTWAAAALAILVAGLVVASTWRNDDPEVSLTVPTVRSDDALVAAQLDAYCQAFLPPVDEAAERYAGGLGSDEARSTLVVALEQAAVGLADLPSPARDRADAGADRLLEAAADARLALVLEVDQDAEVIAALEVLDAVVGDLDPADPLTSCRRS